MSFYAYIHCKPDGTPFYVGKGDMSRVRSLKRRHNPHHTNTVNKYGRANILVGFLECSDEETAFDLERGLIKRIRKMGLQIANFTDGGDGCTGYKHTEEFKKTAAERLLGNKIWEGRKHTEETKAKMREKMLGNKYALGRKHTPESIQKMRNAQRARPKESRFGVRQSREVCIKKSRDRGGRPIEIEKDGVVLRFETIRDAARAINANGGNIVNSLKRQDSGGTAWKVRGWTPRRICE